MAIKYSYWRTISGNLDMLECNQGWFIIAYKGGRKYTNGVPSWVLSLYPKCLDSAPIQVGTDTYARLCEVEIGEFLECRNKLSRILVTMWGLDLAKNGCAGTHIIDPYILWYLFGDNLRDLMVLEGF
jgi:hypothetical protein